MAKKTYARPRYDSPFNREPTGTRFQFADVSGAFTQQFNQARIDEDMLVRALLGAKKAHINKFYFDSTKFDDSPEMTEDFRKIDVHEFVAATTSVKRIEFEQKKVVETKRKERFNSRMNIKKGNVSTRLGYGLNVNYETEEVEYYIFLLYTDAGKSIGRSVEELIDFTKYNLMLFREDKLADTALAIELETPNLQKFIGLAKYDFDESRTVQFLEKDIMREYNAVVKKGNIKQLRTFYEIVPIPLLQFIPDEDLARDLFFMLELDEISSIYDTSDTMLSIMYALSNLESVYAFAIQNPGKIIKVYRHITEDTRREEYCNFLTLLCLLYKDMEGHFPLAKTYEGFGLDSDLFGGNEDTIWLQNVEYIRHYYENSDYDNYWTETFVRFSQDFHPMDIVELISESGTYPIKVPAIYVKFLSDKAEWEQVVKAVTGILNVLSIFASFGVLLRGAAAILRLFAVVDIGISTIDLALANEEFKESLRKSGPAGEWFVKNWPMISMISSMGMLTLELARGFIKYGTRLKNWFKANGKDDFADKMDDFRRQAEKIIKGNYSGTGGQLKFKEVLSRNVFKQEEIRSCAAAAIRQFAKDVGIKLTEKEIRILTNTSLEKGTDATDVYYAMTKVFKDKNIFARGYFDHQDDLLNFKKMLDDAGDSKFITTIGFPPKRHTIIVEKIVDGEVYVKDPWPLEVDEAFVKGIRGEKLESIFNNSEFGVEGIVELEHFRELWFGGGNVMYKLD